MRYFRKFKGYSLSLRMLIVLLPLVLHISILSVHAYNPGLEVVYFYNNPCSACDEEERFYEEFHSLVTVDTAFHEVGFQIYNTFHKSGTGVYAQYMEQFGVPAAQQTTPMLFINDSYLSGEADIKAHLSSTFEREYHQWLSERPSEDSTIIYFYTQLCSACDAVKAFFDTLEEGYLIAGTDQTVYSALNIERYDIAELQHLESIQAYFEAYGVPEEEQQVPIVFIGETYLSGTENIENTLEAAVKAGEGLKTRVISREEMQTPDSIDRLSGYRLTGIFFTGLVNGLNPCSLSMLLFFLSMIIVKKVNLLKLGFAFILGKFIAYFLLGTLFFSLFTTLDLEIFSMFQSAMKLVLLLIVVVVIFINTRDYIAAKKEQYDKITLQLPSVLRRWNHRWIKRLADYQSTRLLLLLSFVLGLLISVGEFLCTGQIYLAAIIYMIQSSPVLDLQALYYFTVYVFALVLPLILMTFLVYKGKGLFDVSEFVRTRYHLIKLLNIIVFVLFGLIILFWF